MDIEEVISEHAVTLGVLVSSVSKIEGFMEESVKGQMRQEVLLEKLANFEANTKTSFDRIHSRVDKLEKQIEKLEPLAYNGNRVYTGLVFTIKAIAALVIGMFFFLAVWAIKLSQYTP